MSKLISLPIRFKVSFLHLLALIYSIAEGYEAAQKQLSYELGRRKDSFVLFHLLLSLSYHNL